MKKLGWDQHQTDVDQFGSVAVRLWDANGVAIGSSANPITIAPGTAAASLGKAEDAGHTTGDVGVMTLGVRNSGSATLTSTDLDYSPIAVDRMGATHVTGPIAHDGVDSGGGPINIGGVAIAGTAAPSAVSAASDRVNAWFDLNGFLHVKNHTQEDAGTTLTAINTTYDNVTTTASSADITTTGYRFVDFFFTLVSASTPTDITFDAEAKDGSTYFKMKNGFLGKFIFDDTAVATSQNIHVRFPCPATGIMRITVTATGTTASLTFTVSNAKIFLST